MKNGRPTLEPEDMLTYLNMKTGYDDGDVEILINYGNISDFNLGKLFLVMDEGLPSLLIQGEYTNYKKYKNPNINDVTSVYSRMMRDVVTRARGLVLKEAIRLTEEGNYSVAEDCVMEIFYGIKRSLRYIQHVNKIKNHVMKEYIKEFIVVYDKALQGTDNSDKPGSIYFKLQIMYMA